MATPIQAPACPSAVVPESLVSASNRVFSNEKKGGWCERVRRSLVHLVVKRPTRRMGKKGTSIMAGHGKCVPLTPVELQHRPAPRLLHRQHDLLQQLDAGAQAQEANAFVVAVGAAFFVFAEEERRAVAVD